MVLISPGICFAQQNQKDRNRGRCGIGGGGGQCQGVPGEYPIYIEEGSLPPSASANLESMSNWFPKMIVTKPIESDIISRDPQVNERWLRDALCNPAGYRARTLFEIQEEQKSVVDMLEDQADLFCDVV